MFVLIAACVIPAFLISCGATAIVRRCAPGWGLMDQPAARKVHSVPVPLGGGIGIWLGVVVPIVAAQAVVWSATQTDWLQGWLPSDVVRQLSGFGLRSGQLWAILAGGTLLSIMGLFDDWRNLPWQPRLMVQLLVACGLVSLGVRATVFVSAPWFGEMLTVLWILVLINSFNFLDNMDGLSAGIALIAAVLFATIMLGFTSESRWLVGGFLLVLAGSLGGFLWHNRPPAKIFMGDTDSYFIGLLLACMTVLGTFYEYKPGSSPHVMLAPLCILAVPLYDFCSVMIIRLSQGRSPFHADKSHFSHRLVELGLSKPAAVLTIHLLTLATGLGALLLYYVPNWNAALQVLALILCVLAVIAILETAGRRGRRTP
jgi:UDP-GlcNAc:undecaprenyl-phosphate GlcNAc-1-phosphate transferase